MSNSKKNSLKINNVSLKIKKPKTVLDMIIFAIRNQPPSTNGVSRSAILKYILAEFDYGKAVQLKNAIKKAVGKGKLVQTGQSFRVEGDPIPKVAAEPEARIEDIKNGTGKTAEAGDTIVVKYQGKLEDGVVFDTAPAFEFTLGAGEVIKGWDKGIISMQVGGQRKLFVPSKLGYGKRGSPPEIPPNSDLYFHVTLRKIK